MNTKKQKARYIIADLLTAAIVWTVFYLFRKLYIERIAYGYPIPVTLSTRYYLGLFIIPAFWLLLYYLKGTYKNVYEKSRLQELWKTLETTFIGVVILFFVLILDDTIYSYKSYYVSISVLFGAHFIITYIPRLIITSRTIRLLRKGKIYFKTLIVGSGKKALNMYNQLVNNPKSVGNHFIGYVRVYTDARDMLKNKLPCLGGYEQLISICQNYTPDEAIIAVETEEHDEVRRVINRLEETNVRIKAIPGLYDMLMGTANISNIYGVPLIKISRDLMPAWEENLKRLLDIVFSLLALILLSPLFIFLIIGVKITSKGPVMYSHERIGRYGKPFTIYKFRSMYQNAESNGPALSRQDDPRITPFGRFMRKSRMDELPQFFNVLRGDMSLVGPRPERQYYIGQIVKQAPHYYHLQKVRPGITSWGQVKYGYAENVEEMIERLQYDIIYIENMSLYTDLKILIYTIKTILSGKGK